MILALSYDSTCSVILDNIIPDRGAITDTATFENKTAYLFHFISKALLHYAGTKTEGTIHIFSE